MNSLLSPEARLLLVALEDSPSAERVRERVQAPGLDWNRVVALSEREKATAALWKVLGSFPGVVPEERRRQLSMLAAVSDFRMQHHRKRLLQVLDVFDSIGVPVVLLKGAALASTVYASFTERPMYDLDLLVRPGDADRAWETLRDLGWIHNEAECPLDFYREHYHLPPLDDPGGTGLALEIHTRPWQGPVDLPADAMWQESREISIGARSTRVPSTSHQILHLATHFAWGHMLRSGGWRTMRDLRQLIRAGSVDWDEVVRLARQTHGAACCFWTFDIARAVADVEIPDRVIAALRPPLPRAAIAPLRHHYIGTMFEFSPAPCPSLRLGRMMWTAGHAPGQGLVGMRPWMRDAEWALHTHAAPPVGLREGLKNHLLGFRSWAHYFRALLTPSAS